MTEPKPSKAPKSWRGKMEKRPADPHYGEMQPVKYVSRPNLLMRIGSWFYERRTGK